MKRPYEEGVYVDVREKVDGNVTVANGKNISISIGSAADVEEILAWDWLLEPGLEVDAVYCLKNTLHRGVDDDKRKEVEEKIQDVVWAFATGRLRERYSSFQGKSSGGFVGKQGGTKSIVGDTGF
jgi:hypothetical protein